MQHESDVTISIRSVAILSDSSVYNTYRNSNSTTENEIRLYMCEPCNFQVEVFVPSILDSFEYRGIETHIWTNVCDKFSSTGRWHGIPARKTGIRLVTSGRIHTFCASVIPIHCGVFEYTAKVCAPKASRNEWIWEGQYEKNHVARVIRTGNQSNTPINPGSIRQLAHWYDNLLIYLSYPSTSNTNGCVSNSEALTNDPHLFVAAYDAAFLAVAALQMGVDLETCVALSYYLCESEWLRNRCNCSRVLVWCIGSPNLSNTFSKRIQCYTLGTVSLDEVRKLRFSLKDLRKYYPLIPNCLLKLASSNPNEMEIHRKRLTTPMGVQSLSSQQPCSITRSDVLFEFIHSIVESVTDPTYFKLDFYRQLFKSLISTHNTCRQLYVQRILQALHNKAETTGVSTNASSSSSLSSLSRTNSFNSCDSSYGFGSTSSAESSRNMSLSNFAHSLAAYSSQQSVHFKRAGSSSSGLGSICSLEAISLAFSQPPAASAKKNVTIALVELLELHLEWVMQNELHLKSGEVDAMMTTECVTQQVPVNGSLANGPLTPLLKLIQLLYVSQNNVNMGSGGRKGPQSVTNDNSSPDKYIRRKLSTEGVECIRMVTFCLLSLLCKLNSDRPDYQLFLETIIQLAKTDLLTLDLIVKRLTQSKNEFSGSCVNTLDVLNVLLNEFPNHFLTNKDIQKRVFAYIMNCFHSVNAYVVLRVFRMMEYSQSNIFWQMLLQSSEKSIQRFSEYLDQCLRHWLIHIRLSAESLTHSLETAGIMRNGVIASERLIRSIDSETVLRVHSTHYKSLQSSCSSPSTTSSYQLSE